MTELLKKEQTISSFEIAQITGKKHAHVLRDIRTMEPAWEKVHKSKFGFMFKIINLPNRASRKDPYYELNKIEFLYVITKYSDEARAKLVMRWAELEEKNILIPHCQVNCNDFFQNTSNGVSQPKHFLGIKLILIITSSTTLFVNDEKSVPLGKYLLNIPLVCSLVPLSHE